MESFYKTLMVACIVVVLNIFFEKIFGGEINYRQIFKSSVIFFVLFLMIDFFKK